ncbi:MAG: homoserine dehydrogenase [Clostridia bacterium]|nr:homoserine dehydrogenase [Oscillospiraceae bacterium]MBR2410237.1 homoserine dehydrogenase [Clostridia bacterium]
MKIAVLGCGTVGSGVVDILDEKKELMVKSAGEEISVKYILDIRDFTGSPYESRIVKDIDIIAEDEEIGCVVETMGGVEPAFTFCKKCLSKGKSVVTSNKALVAAKAQELFKTARENNAAFMFEAAVCGGIPVIRTMFSALSANNILSFSGILNGTTNFILTKMIDEKMSFDTALKIAQEKGYAEKDPTADVDGLDAGRKTCILASIAYGSHVYPEEIHTEGIRNITLEDAAYAANAGCRIKLLGKAHKLNNGKIGAIVCPFLVNTSSLISDVNGVYNAISITGDSIGDVLLYGQGAGKEATASAVTGDVMECVRLKKNEKHYFWEEHKDNVLEDYMLYETALFVRGYAKNKEDSLINIREAFGGVRVIEREDAPSNEIAFITGRAAEKELRDILSELRDFAPASVIRMLD